MTESIQTKTERTIASYLMGLVSEVYGEIIEYNTLTDLQADMLNRTYQKTIQWIGEIGANIDGQYQLLNTLSKDEVGMITRYRNKGIDDRLMSMAECRDAFGDFFSYLWKIMLNICQEQVNTKTEIKKHAELYDPRYYIDQSVKDYICFSFPEDNANYSVILPSVIGRPRIVAKKIISRIVNLEGDVPKPQKWFFSNYSNNEILRGKYDYNLNMADIKEKSTIVDLEETDFYIECMNCININAGGWTKQEHCSNCIFSEECAGEGR